MAAINVGGVRILHTSDWHLGRTLHGIDMHEHQVAFLDHVIDLVTERDIDAVLVSGDVYDRAFPAVETVKLLSATLSRLSARTTVIITPGNHDSATRLGFGSEVMRDSVRILASVAEVDRPVILEGPDHDVAVYGLPYLDPDLARAALVDADGNIPARSHEGVLSAAITRVRRDLDARTSTDRPVRSILMAHAFVIGAMPSDSERDITIGGVDSAPSAIFGGFDYIALGHLHGPQVVPVPGAETIARYSGSPLAYSFSEKDHHKSSALIEFGPDGVPTVELIPTPVPRALTHIEGTMDELLGPKFARHVNDWVRIWVSDTSYPPEMQTRLRGSYPNALVIQHVPGAFADATAAPAVTEAMNPVQVTGEFVRYVTTKGVDDAEEQLLNQAYDEVNKKARIA